MINDVLGGELGQTLDGKWEVLDRNGNNVFTDGRVFPDINQAARIAEMVGENTAFLTPEAIAQRRPKRGNFDMDALISALKIGKNLTNLIKLYMVCL